MLGFPSYLASSSSNNNDIFLVLQKTSHILSIPIPFLCPFSILFTILFQYLLMLQALSTCLIYASCISLYSSPELIPYEFSELFLKKTSFLRSTSLGSITCDVHIATALQAGQQTLWQKMRNKIQSLQFHSSLTSRAILCVPLASRPWFLFSSWVVPKLEGQEKFLRWDFWGFFVQMGVFWVKNTRLKIKQSKHFLVLTEISHLWRCLSTILAFLHWLYYILQ